MARLSLRARRFDDNEELVLLVFGLITISVLGSLVIALLLGWIAYAIVDTFDTLTDKPECLKPEDETKIEDATELEFCVHELDNAVRAVPFKDTISQSEPAPPSTEEASPAVTPNQPNGIPKLAQNKDESVEHKIVQKSTQKEESLRVPPTDIMTTHSSNTAKSFQKLLQFAVSQGPSKTDVSATSTQVEAVADSSLEQQTDETTASVARNQRSIEGKGKKKKNKRNKGRNGKHLTGFYDTTNMWRIMKFRYSKSFYDFVV